MPRKEYTGISLKEEFAASIEKIIEEHPELGYRSIAQFVEDAARRHLENLRAQEKIKPRFEQINSDENGVKILDRELRKVIDIYFKPSGLKCSFHLSDDCEHVEFALKQRDVQDFIRMHRKDGWKLPEV